MEASDVYVYLWFNAITDEQRDAFLKRLAKVLPAIDAALTERYDRRCVRLEGRDDNAAFLIVDRLVKGVRSELSLADDQVTLGLDPHLI